MIRLALRDFKHDLLATGLGVLTSGVLIFAFLLLIATSLALSQFATASGPPLNLYVLESQIISPEESQLPVDMVVEVAEMLGPDALRVDPLIFRIMRVEGNTIQLRGVSLEAMEQSFQLRLVEGNWPTHTDEIVVGSLAAERGGWRPGSTVRIYGKDFRISGLTDGPGTKTYTVWMSYSTASELFDQPDNFEVLVVKLNSDIDPVAAKQVLEQELQSGGTYETYLEDALLREYGAAFHDLRALSTLLTIIAIVAVSFGSHNQAWLAAEQRRAQLGILRSIGFTRRSVEWYLNLHGLTLNMVGYGFAYLLAGLFVRIVLDGELHNIAGYRLTLSLDLPVVFSGLMLSSLATLLGTWLSSRNTVASSPAALIGRGPGSAFS